MKKRDSAVEVDTWKEIERKNRIEIIESNNLREKEGNTVAMMERGGRNQERKHEQ